MEDFAHGHILLAPADIVNDVIAAWRSIFSAASAAAPLTPDAAEAAFAGMRGGGGHAIRHLVEEGLIPNSGSLASRVDAAKNLLKPILQNPTHVFGWRVGATQATGFVGEAGGRTLVAFIAKEGAYAGRLISSGVANASDLALWGLAP